MHIHGHRRGVTKKLGEAGYRLNPKMRVFQKRSRIDPTQKRPKRETTSTRQTGSDNKGRNTKKQNGIQVLPRSNTIRVKVYRKTTLLKKQNKWTWTDEYTKVFNNLKKLITQLPSLAHYNSKSENNLTTDASTKGLGATLWLHYGRDRRTEI